MKEGGGEGTILRDANRRCQKHSLVCVPAPNFAFIIFLFFFLPTSFRPDVRMGVHRMGARAANRITRGQGKRSDRLSEGAPAARAIRLATVAEFTFVRTRLRVGASRIFFRNSKDNFFFASEG